MSQPTGGLFQKTDRAMSTGINGLETAVSDCWRIHQNVMDTTSALPNSWQGEAATAFTKLLATWDDDFNQIVSPGPGQEVAQSFSLYLDSTFASFRPFVIDESGDTPPDWSQSSGSRTTLNWGLTAAPNCYYRQVNSAAEKAVAPIVLKENSTGNKAYACMNASAYTDEAGTSSIARLSIAASLQSLAIAASCWSPPCSPGSPGRAATPQSPTPRCANSSASRSAPSRR